MDSIVTKSLKYLDRLSDRFVWRPLALRMSRHVNDMPFFHPDPGRVTIGKNVRLANTVINTRSGTVTLEDNVFFGHGCMLLAGTHDYHVRGASRQPAVPPNGQDIVIKNGAFIASGVIVIGPCVIGSDAVVSAGSVVHSDLPPGWLCAGNPAQAIREIRFSDTT